MTSAQSSSPREASGPERSSEQTLSHQQRARTRAPSATELGNHYDKLYRASPFEDRPALYRHAIRRADTRRGSRALDIACGIGGALVAFESVGVRPVGVDLSSEALERSHDRAPKALLVRADGARLPFCDGSFDVVTHLGNLEHFEDLRGGIREVRRILSPDGRAVFLLPNLFYSGAIWRVLRTGYGPNHHQPIDRFATRAEWQDLLVDEGLRVLSSEPYHKGKWWKQFLPAAFAWHFLYVCAKGEPRTSRRAVDPLERRNV